MNKRFWKKLKWLHKWPSLILSIFFILWPLSGIILNHRETFSNIEVSRENLSEEYWFENWNNASIKGIIHTEGDSVLIYGDIGIWLFYNNLQDHESFNKGFKKGIDNRKIYTMLRSDDGSLFAGTRTGLFKWSYSLKKWQSIPLSDYQEKVVGLTEKEGVVYCMTRSHIYKLSPSVPHKILKIEVRPPQCEDMRISLFKTLWIIHTGEMYGIPGKLIVDLVGITFIFLSFTGWIYFLFPSWIKRRKKKSKAVVKILKINRFSIKWHKKIGIWMVTLMLITATTGMFLRPPLLILIANSTIGKIPYTILDQANPWYDRFRDILWDEELKLFAIGTVEGIYFVDENFEKKPILPPVQPPISVMGINVFKSLDKGRFLVGSFSGLFVWSPSQGWVVDYLTGMPVVEQSGPAKPISKNMATAHYTDHSDRKYYFDYNAGAIPVGHNQPFIKMPEEVKDASPMSLWNFALEIHTARILKVIMGPLYILFIPLFGFFTVLILILGLILWIRKYLRKRKRK